MCTSSMVVSAIATRAPCSISVSGAKQQKVFNIIYNSKKFSYTTVSLYYFEIGGFSQTIFHHFVGARILGWSQYHPKEAYSP